MSHASIPLAVAAQQLRRSYQKTRDLLLTGAIDGEFKDGRWYVDAESVERLRKATEPQVA